MKLISRLVAGLVVVGALVAASEHDAHALGPVDVEAGLKVGVGTNPDSKAPATIFGFGLGGRAGVDIFHVYLGASAIHYFGGSTTLLGADVSNSTNLFGGELGYTITALPIVRIRPQLGLGTAVVSSSVGNISTSDSHLYLEPGVTVLVPLGIVYVGADANALILPGVDTTTSTGASDTKTYTSLTIHGQVGVTF